MAGGHPIVIAAVLNLDPFWAAVIAYLIAGKKIPTSFFTFALCLIVSFVGAMLLAGEPNERPIHWSADVQFWFIFRPSSPLIKSRTSRLGTLCWGLLPALPQYVDVRKQGTDFINGLLGLALPVPVLWALSGTFVGKWFSDFDEYACIAVTFTMAAVVVVPIALAIAYTQSGLQLTTDVLPALALLAIGTILATGFGRVLYQRSLTITDNNNGFVSVFFS